MKLPNGYGSIYKLKGKRRKPWCCRKTVGWNVVESDGMVKSYPKYEYIGYYPTRKEAMNALIEYNADPYDLIHQNITFKEVYDLWSEEHFKKLKQTAHYKAAVKVCAPLFDMRIADLKLTHYQKVFNESGKNSPTLNNTKNVITGMYDYCVKNEILPVQKREIVSYIDTSCGGNPNARPHKNFDADEVDKLWILSDDPVAQIVLIMVYTGTRVNELLNLKKTDVHLQEKYFHIAQSKTESGTRDVPICDKIMPFVEKHMEADGNYLISINGKQIRYNTYFVPSLWAPLMERAGISDDHRPHDTRHTFVSMATEAGIDERIIQQIVGHAGKNVTESVYTHISMEAKLEAVNKL